MATNSNIEVLSAEATLAGEVTITVISPALPREDGHIAVLDSNNVEIAHGTTFSPSPGGSSTYDSVYNIPVGRYQATWYSETYGEYVNKIPITVGNPDSQFYGPEKRLASIGSYTLESFSPFDPAIVSIDLATFKNFLNSQINYIKVINSEATFSKIAVYVAYVDNIYRFRISLATGGSGTSLRGFTDENHDALVSTVRNNTGISLTPTFGSMTQASSIVPDGMTYVYDSKRVSKFYGSVERPESFSATPDGVLVESLNGVTLCARAKSQYPNRYTETDHFLCKCQGSEGTGWTFGISGRTAQDEQTLYVTGSRTSLENAGVVFSSTPTNTTVQIPATYVAGDRVSKEITKLYGSVNGQTKLIYEKGA